MGPVLLFGLELILNAIEWLASTKAVALTAGGWLQGCDAALVLAYAERIASLLASNSHCRKIKSVFAKDYHFQSKS